MNIQLTSIKIKDLFEGYTDKAEEGVFAYNGLLSVRPAYQREFVYKEKQRNAVIQSILSGFPLNTMYWSKNEDGTYELLDGQQRTISICQFLNGEYSVDYNFFNGLPQDKKDIILNYTLQVYICEGKESEKLDWFKVINVAGEKLTDQELLNINYTGAWLSDAKQKFSKTGCVAYKLGKDYVKGSPIRQEFLETALDWISNGDIISYMSKHKEDADAAPLWIYYQQVIAWVTALFPKYRKEMKGVNWGALYNEYKDKTFSNTELEKKVSALMKDDDVTKKAGIYSYVFNNQEKFLSIRAFTDSQKRSAFEKQNGVCPICGKTHTFEEMEGDHIIPWSKGGKTDVSNLQMICKNCNRTKSNK